MDISAFPSGYLDLIGARNKGKGVSVAADVLSPTIDMGRLLGLSRRIPSQNTLPFIAGKNTFMTVPIGKVWNIVLGYTAFTTGVGVTAQGAHAYVEPANLQGNVIGLADSIDLVASQIRSIAFRFSNILVGPGDKIGVASGVVAGAPTAYVSLLVEEFNA